MKKYYILLLLTFLLTGCSHGDELLRIKQIRCSGLTNPAGTVISPDFSWELSSEARGKKQSAWQIIVSSGNKFTPKSEVWNSGKVSSGKSAWNTCDGRHLLAGKEYFWRVRVWDEKGRKSPWSSTGKFITGLPGKKDWSGARWIGYEEIPDSLLLVPGVHGSGDNLGNLAIRRTIIPYFRQEFSLGKEIEKAVVFISGLGHYELYLNGNKIGDTFLSPGWTDYRKKCLYNTYDVTENLQIGPNCVGVIAGNGFYNINRERYRKLVIAYGAPKMIMKLLISYTDGTQDVIISDDSWKTCPSPIVYSGIYGGEDYDATLEQPGWNKPGFNDAGWKYSILAREPEGGLLPETDYPVKVMEEFEPSRISYHEGTWVYDFGQNASGTVSMRVNGERGEKVTLVPGELLDDDSIPAQQATGEPYYYSYVIKGNEEEHFIPRFTYYGFRYVQVKGAVPDGKPNPAKLPVIREMKLLHTRNSSPESGSFKCSNELFNSIYDLIKWSVKSNLASVATDCPHREKLGWLEQTHLMGNSIRYLYDVHNLYEKIVDDMIDAQLDNGLVPDIAPEYVPFVEGFRDSPEWGSACIMLPFDLYQWYGDTDAVSKAYPMMQKYIAYLQGMAENNILSHGLGDWFDLGPRTPGEAQLTPRSLTATATYYYDVKLLSGMASLLGKNRDAGYYADLAETIRDAFNSEFFDPVTGVYSTGSQTAYSMPLYFGIADEYFHDAVVKNLVASIKAGNNALTAGDIGYRYLLRVLEQEGLSRLIFEMNSRTDVPGYGFQISKGATSLTESWAALRYVSNNHMMLGHLMEWFYSGLAGIRQAEGSDSFEHILFAPQPAGDVTWASASYHSIRGEIACSWKTENGKFMAEVSVPANSDAIFAMPLIANGAVTVDDVPLDSRDIRTEMSTGGAGIHFSLQSGKHIVRAGLN